MKRLPLRRRFFLDYDINTMDGLEDSDSMVSDQRKASSLAMMLLMLRAIANAVSMEDLKTPSWIS
jgi:hypothetical protein